MMVKNKFTKVCVNCSSVHTHIQHIEREAKVVCGLPQAKKKGRLNMALK